MIPTGRARVAGVIGWPVEHSRSPRLHGHWLERYGIDGAYVPLAVRPEHLPEALFALPRLGFRGVNVTVPHKEAALAIVDLPSEAATRMGAVNTLWFDDEGRIHGDNTDAAGFLAHLRATCREWQASAGPALLLGAGGAARAVAWALLEAGVPEIVVANRTRQRAEALAQALGSRARAVAWPPPHAELSGTLLLVNTTSLGMEGAPPLDLDLEALASDAIVYDIVYVPLETPLLRAARVHGNPTVDGLGMLLHQAVPGFRRWFGHEPAVDGELRRFVLADLERGRR